MSGQYDPTAIDTPEIDPRALRNAFGSFATGVTIVATRGDDGAPVGFTANSFTSVSLDPPLLLVCPAKSMGSFPAFANAEAFAVSVLAETQRDVSAAFATPGAKRFEVTPWSAGRTGSPVIDGCVAWFDCQTQQAIDAGDHTILIGRVIACDHNAQPPLGYCRGAYVTFGLAGEAVEAVRADGASAIGAVVECDSAILMQRNEETGALELPMATHLGAPDQPKSLLGLLHGAGVTAQLPFVFAVYDEDDVHRVIYRGEATSARTESDGFRFIPLDALEWDRVPSPTVRAMLQRYLLERREGAFGMYVGDAEAGSVHPTS